MEEVITEFNVKQLKGVHQSKGKGRAIPERGNSVRKRVEARSIVEYARKYLTVVLRSFSP